uniref:Chloroplast envelope membrane protein n=1 Tax=Aegilops tauschii subsp. strangulata TaxID=200361 RepID=A0A453AIC3_AEGTS
MIICKNCMVVLDNLNRRIICTRRNNDFGWAPNELIFTIFVCSFPVILDTCLKFWVFFCLTPSDFKVARS